MIDNTAVNLKANTREYYLSDFYKPDIWDLTKHPLFPQLTDSQKKILINRNHTLDFTVLNSEIFKNEIKFYCQHMIEAEKRLLSYFATHIGGITLTINFFNNEMNQINSLLDIESEQATQYFSQYLIANGYKTHTEAKNALNKDMEHLKYKNPTTYLRFFISLINFIHEQAKKNNTDTYFFDRDIWDIRDLPFKVQGFDTSRPRYTLSFENIPQKEIRLITKKYTLERLKIKKYSTCMDNLKGIRVLAQFLNDNYPAVQSLAQLDRPMIEDFIGYVNLNNNFSARTQSKIIGNIKTFFETCTLFGWDEIPDRTLLIGDDVKKKIKTLPKFYEDEVLKKLNENLEFLPVQIARMVFVLQNVGMRISELCMLKTDCLKQDTEKDYLIEYFQEKTQEWNRVPIKSDVATAISEAIKYSEEQYGKSIKYVFMQDNIRPISKDTFSYHLNQLVKKRDIRDSNGNLVRIKAHHFRGTLATKYANMGMSSNLIRELLGQKCLGTLRHYVEILEETITDAMQDLLSYQDQMIQNIGKKEVVIQVVAEDAIEIPLPNGRCAKPLSTGKCTHANACYTCSVFKPDPSNLDLFKYQLSEAKSNIEMAKINGYERVQQVNEDLVLALEKIITSIEK